MYGQQVVRTNPSRKKILLVLKIGHIGVARQSARNRVARAHSLINYTSHIWQGSKLLILQGRPLCGAGVFEFASEPGVDLGACESMVSNRRQNGGRGLVSSKNEASAITKHASKGLLLFWKVRSEHALHHVLWAVIRLNRPVEGIPSTFIDLLRRFIPCLVRIAKPRLRDILTYRHEHLDSLGTDLVGDGVWDGLKNPGWDPKKMAIE